MAWLATREDTGGAGGAAQYLESITRRVEVARNLTTRDDLDAKPTVEQSIVSAFAEIRDLAAD
jgi:hypothetical protein